MEEDSFTDLLYSTRLEPIPFCEGEECLAFDVCTYTCLDSSLGTPRCEVMKIYLESVASEIYSLFKHSLDQSQTFRIAHHLLPLYKTLCRLIIDEFGVKSSLRVGKSGKVTMNPIYREIRETIKTIEGAWSLIGIDKAPLLKPSLDGMESKVSTAMVRSKESIIASLERKLDRGKIIKGHKKQI